MVQEKTVFETGAWRDSKQGKGRCDLMPLDVLNVIFQMEPDEHGVLKNLEYFKEYGVKEYLYAACRNFIEISEFESVAQAFLEVAIHFEEGAIVHGDDNWKKGLPVYSFIDSGTRHYLKWLDGQTDERHDRALLWNLICGIWTCENKPEMNGYSHFIVLKGEDCCEFDHDLKG